MSVQELNEIIRAVETWQHQREEVFKRQAFQDGANAKSLREFVEIQNRLSRKLISLTQKNDEHFWSALAELGNNAARIVTQGKVFVNKEDVTQEGM